MHAKPRKIERGKLRCGDGYLRRPLVQVSLNPDDAVRLRKMAETQDVSLSSLVNRAVTSFLHPAALRTAVLNRHDLRIAPVDTKPPHATPPRVKRPTAKRKPLAKRRPKRHRPDARTKFTRKLNRH